MNKKNFEERIVDLNIILEEKQYVLDLYIAGGMAFILKELVSRVTRDVDVFKTMNKEVESILNDFDINTDISQIIKDNSYKKYSDIDPEFTYLSNINVYVVTNEYLVALKYLSVISPNRSKENKEKDLEDVKTLLSIVDFSIVFEIIDLWSKKSITEFEAKYLKKEVKEWQKKFQ